LETAFSFVFFTLYVHGTSRKLAHVCVLFFFISYRKKMSIRPDADKHITVRATMVSTSRLSPSRLHVSVVQQWGLPNYHGLLIVDGVTLHVTFDRQNQDLVLVWAEREDATSACLVS
jgi:hypothetical protein